MNRAPKLRFPEFSGEWEEKKVTDISILKGGYAFKSDKFLGAKSLYQVIKMGNVYQNNLLLDKNPSYLSDITEREKEYLLKNGDIIITLTGTVGKRDFGYSYQIMEEENLLLNQRLALFRTSPNHDNNKFLRYILLKKQFLDQFFESSTGGTGNQANVSIKNMEDFIVTTTSLPEQQEIASFLSSVDSKIEKLERKKELWERYKKGMMQKIFSQELRFKPTPSSASSLCSGRESEEDYPEWEEKSLGEIGEIITGKTPSTEDQNLWNGTIQFVTPTDIDHNKYQLSTLRTVSDNIKTKILPQKSIMYTCIASIGKIALSVVPCITNQQINSLITYEQNNEFIYYALLSITPQIKVTQANTTLPIINKTEFSKFILKIPSLPEQTQIANFLSSIDSKIEIVSKELHGMKEFKKGLLQQMFV